MKKNDAHGNTIGPDGGKPPAERDTGSECFYGTPAGRTVSYIRSIQEELLLSSRLTGGMPGYFIYFRPLAAVSGDFYWMHDAGGKQVIVMADCTGHGLQGANLSILGMTLLDRIVAVNKVLRPDEILGQLRDEVIKSVNTVKGDYQVRDGMDVAVCTVDTGEGTLLYSGANLPLYLVSEGRLLNYRPDKMPVSVHYRMDTFTLHTISLKKGDTFYMFSDGYADQPGGPRKRKFMSGRLRKLLVEMEGLPLESQRERVESVYLGWKGDNQQIDDVTIIGVRY